MTERETFAPVVSVVGATGAAGTTLVRTLEERRFGLSDLKLFASSRSAGATVRFRGSELTVHEVDGNALHGSDVVFFAAGSSVSREFAPLVAEAGGVAIDKSSAFRMDPAIPLIVPEVNPEAVARHSGIIANPNCVVIPLTVALAPLHRVAGLIHLTVATYQAASGAGTALRTELQRQVQDDAAGKTPVAEVYPHVLHGNVVPGGWRMEGEATEEEVKVVGETRRVLGMPRLPIAVTTVRVPVEVGHSLAVWAEFDHALSAAGARRVLASAPGVKVVDDPVAQEYPTPRMAAGTDWVYVGRIREDSTRRNGLSLFIAADNLRKGAATNAVQVAELALAARTP
ncbi:MAG TPA: aspartate-semialdehyde dehydrogenase [Chloroflexota bacterium]|nr:aspartate-semialdehyde dehydrogenase [Chloroflexota bacterium]